MAYDETLADRVRDLTGLPDKKMFGGIAFLLSGTTMAVAVLGDDLLVRVGPDRDDLLAEPGVRLMDMGGRTMAGWLLVAGETLDDDVLRTWVDRGVTYAASLPPKKA